MPGQLYTLDGRAPKVHETAWVAPNAVLVGAVEIGPGASVWYNCVLRGDNEPIVIGEKANIQDGTVMHSDPGQPVTIGARVTVGHMCLIHACTLEDDAFVGMNSTVMNLCVIEARGMLAAGALLSPNKRIRKGELWSGIPAKMWKELDDKQLAANARTPESYFRRSRKYMEQFGW